MTEPMKQRWEDVGQRFEALGRVLKERYQSAEGAHSTASAPAADQDEATEDRAALREAFDKVLAAAQELGERAASVVRDPAVKEQTTLVARSLNDALTVSVDQLGDEVGKLLKRAKGAGPSGASGSGPSGSPSSGSPGSHDEPEPPTAGPGGGG